MKFYTYYCLAAALVMTVVLLWGCAPPATPTPTPTWTPTAYKIRTPSPGAIRPPTPGPTSSSSQIERQARDIQRRYNAGFSSVAEVRAWYRDSFALFSRTDGACSVDVTIEIESARWSQRSLSYLQEFFGLPALNPVDKGPMLNFLDQERGSYERRCLQAR